MKTDISKNELYIKNMSIVIQSGMYKNRGPVCRNGRPGDAFVYILSGSCMYTFDDGYCFTVSEGDILYLADKSVYTMNILTEKYTHIFCDFLFDDDTLRQSDVFTPKSNTENLFHKLLRSYKSNSFTDCMSTLYQIYGAVRSSVNHDYIERSSKQKIEKIKDFIDQHFQETALSISALADIGNMSEVYFRRLFKSLYGVTPSQYITSARIEKSKELMKYPFLTLEECALQCGFSTLQYFCRVFKSTVGMTPAAYRRDKYGI